MNSSDGTVSDQTDFTKLAPLTSSSYVQDYAVKHNPFAYFKSVQDGSWGNNLDDIVGFDGPRGLYADLAADKVPSLAFIAPSQCDDQHGKGNSDALCASDPGIPPGSNNTVGTQVGLNPGLILRGDVTIERLVQAIKASRVWNEGRDAIVIVWDENDYSGLPNNTNGVFPPQNQNKVVLTVETNYADSGVLSRAYYNSFSLLKSMEAGFGLPCLNHACDGAQMSCPICSPLPRATATMMAMTWRQRPKVSRRSKSATENKAERHLRQKDRYLGFDIRRRAAPRTTRRDAQGGDFILRINP